MEPGEEGEVGHEVDMLGPAWGRAGRVLHRQGHGASVVFIFCTGVVLLGCRGLPPWSGPRVSLVGSASGGPCASWHHSPKPPPLCYPICSPTTSVSLTSQYNILRVET